MNTKTEQYTRDDLARASTEALYQYADECRQWLRRLVLREHAYQEKAREFGNEGDAWRCEDHLIKAKEARAQIDQYTQEVKWCDEIVTERIQNSQLTFWGDIPF